MRSLGDVAGDFVEMELHRLGVGEGERKRRPDASGGTNGAEEIGALITLIGSLAWAPDRRRKRKSFKNEICNPTPKPMAKQ